MLNLLKLIIRNKLFGFILSTTASSKSINTFKSMGSTYTGNSSYNPSTGPCEKTCLRPKGGKYVVKCTLSLVNTVYLVKLVEDRRNRKLRVYKGDRTVWSGSTANSNNDYYVSNCDNWELVETHDDIEFD